MTALLGLWRYVLWVTVLAAAGVWHLTDKSKAVDDATELVRAEYINAALAASEAARSREHSLIEINRKANLDLQAHKNRSAAAAGVNAGKLRDLEVALDRALAASRNTTTTAGANDPSAGIIRECSRTLVALDDHASKLAWQLTGLQRYIGEVCQSKP